MACYDRYVPYKPETEEITSCGIPQNYDASKEFKDKKVVLVAVPGAFTPGCSVRHLPGFIEHKDKLKTAGVDAVVILAFNDAFVMSAWGKANKVTGHDILFMSDPGTKFSQSIGWTFGERTGRYAIVIDHGKVTYADKESSPGDVTVSGVDAVLKAIS
ncbi:MAG: hypothetical protein MMC33_003306 [Icmadophila ericetorum]|nr:hypothetical protein [Icmadophila ericetorum]